MPVHHLRMLLAALVLAVFFVNGCGLAPNPDLPSIEETTAGTSGITGDGDGDTGGDGDGDGDSGDGGSGADGGRSGVGSTESLGGEGGDISTGAGGRD